MCTLIAKCGGSMCMRIGTRMGEYGRAEDRQQRKRGESLQFCCCCCVGGWVRGDWKIERETLLVKVERENRVAATRRHVYDCVVDGL